MLDMSDEALAVVQGSYTMQIRAESWLGGTLLADNIPVSDGTESTDRSMSVPEQLSLTIPARDQGIDWNPVAPDHPLQSYGQQLRVDYGIDLGTHTEWINRGWFLITGSSCDGDTVSVTAAGLLTLIDEAKFAGPFQPSTTDTLVSVARSLVEPALTVNFDAALTDRAVPSSIQWDDDRLGALNSVLTAWPADMRVTEDGLLFIEPVATTGDPVLSLTDGENGTVVDWSGSSSRDGAFNVVVCQGQDADGNQIQGVAYDADGSSPFRIGGPFNPLPVPYTAESPLMTTVDMCRKAAETTLQQLRRTSSRTIGVTMVPHPGLIAGDFVSLTSKRYGLRNVLCSVESLSLPYSPSTQTLNARVI